MPNVSNAFDKMIYVSPKNHEVTYKKKEKIEMIPDPDEKILIRDSVIRKMKENVVNSIGTKKLIEGQFDVGFYSETLLSERVVVGI
ncbi:hypothetical protein RFI_05449 [Reticulomyxa filosa]|uniref:Uncharacterized protein n=1 Tax=Reticulomyxa filosa TaxID=46433 RepID=X6NZD3_RETFI|nr:hypothetical protein RFI_05449 [Reticulomyxa filosa]|eukprot:ETO31670.1 hypothetical protein RFI_05449 [Reticulomyxa filosa]